MMDGVGPEAGLFSRQPNCSLPTMEQLASNATWAEALRRADTAIAPLNLAGERIPIYWVHSVTGLGTDPIRLAKLLGSSQPFYTVRAPSRSRTASFVRSVEEIASYYTREIAQFQPHGPLIIGGWSAGVVVALEMAQQLRAAGRDVRHLIAVDFAPRTSDIRPNSVTRFVIRMINWLHKEYGSKISLTQRTVRILEKIRETTHATLTRDHPLDELIRSLGCTKTEGEFIRRLHDEVERYVPAAYDGSVLLYVAVEDDGHRAGSNRNIHARSMIRVWQSLAHNLVIARINGDHESLLKGDSIIALAKRMADDLR